MIIMQSNNHELKLSVNEGGWGHGLVALHWPNVHRAMNLMVQRHQKSGRGELLHVYYK